MNKRVILKPDKDKAIRNRHHWIFSGAVQTLPEFTDGEILSVFSHGGQLLGSAYFNRKSAILGRMVAFDERPPLEAIKNSLDHALSWRQHIFDPSITNGYRLINGEGDFLPGLIVDRYQDHLVIQISTLGMERLRDWLVDYFRSKLSPKSIYEKSNLPSRKEEGLGPIQQQLYGVTPDTVEILENGLRFEVEIAEGQKTGFFLDHREMRQWVRSLANGKRVLNCFSYSGAFSVYAAAGHAVQVDSVDISEKAIENAKRNASLNGSKTSFGWHIGDVFQYLRDKPLQYDMVILDPPAFAKRKKDVVAGCRGYKDINRVAMQKMPEKSLLLTCSCSYHIDEALFQKVLFQAAVEAGRNVRIVGTHRMAVDHPVNICHPESDYLKSLLLFVE